MKHYRVGSKFKLTADAVDNYGEQYRGTIHTVRAVYTHYVKASEMANDPTGHPGFDAGAGSMLFGSDLPFDVYAWEIRYV